VLGIGGFVASQGAAYADPGVIVDATTGVNASVGGGFAGNILQAAATTTSSTSAGTSDDTDSGSLAADLTNRFEVDASLASDELGTSATAGVTNSAALTVDGTLDDIGGLESSVMPIVDNAQNSVDDLTGVLDGSLLNGEGTPIVGLTEPLTGVLGPVTEGIGGGSLTGILTDAVSGEADGSGSATTPDLVGMAFGVVGSLSGVLDGGATADLAPALEDLKGGLSDGTTLSGLTNTVDETVSGFTGDLGGGPTTANLVGPLTGLVGGSADGSGGTATADLAGTLNGVVDSATGGIGGGNATADLAGALTGLLGLTTSN
jgi:hypothetical protein